MFWVQAAPKEADGCYIFAPVLVRPDDCQVIYIMVVMQAWLDSVTEALSIICRWIEDGGVAEFHG